MAQHGECLADVAVVARSRSDHDRLIVDTADPIVNRRQLDIIMRTHGIIK